MLKKKNNSTQPVSGLFVLLVDISLVSYNWRSCLGSLDAGFPLSPYACGWAIKGWNKSGIFRTILCLMRIIAKKWKSALLGGNAI